MRWYPVRLTDKSLKKHLAPARNNLARSLRKYRKLCKAGERYSYEGALQFGICLGEQTQLLAAEHALQDIRFDTIASRDYNELIKSENKGSK